MTSGRTMKSAVYHGLLVIDKPAGLTSRDVVNRAQGWFPRRTPLGHTGTLDPLATGVLVLCVGVATRLAEYVQRMAKTYRAGILLGARSDTDDADGAIEQVTLTQPPPDHARVLACLQSLVGDIDQLPPAYSAARVAGQRAYDLARRGQAVALQPRQVKVYSIDLLAFDYPHAEIEVRCGKGTYIRSLAREIGERLSCGGLVRTLRRTAVGSFEASQAVSLDANAATAKSRLMPLSAAVADLPRVVIEDALIQRLRQGQAISLTQENVSGGSVNQEIAVFNSVEGLVAVALLGANNLVRPVKVLP